MLSTNDARSPMLLMVMRSTFTAANAPSINGVESGSKLGNRNLSDPLQSDMMEMRDERREKDNRGRLASSQSLEM